MCVFGGDAAVRVQRCPAPSVAQSPAILSSVLISLFVVVFLKIRFCESFCCTEIWFHCSIISLFMMVEGLANASHAGSKKAEVSKSINSWSWGQSRRVFLFFWRLLSWMWNAWGYNTECRPNHQVVKFLNAIICVPTVSCGYKIVPKNLKVREYKAQTKQILSSIFFPLFPPRFCGTFLFADKPGCSSFPRGVSVCMVSQASSICQQGATGPGRDGRIWSWSLSAVNDEQLDAFLPKRRSSSVFLSKIPIKALTLSLKGTYLLRSNALRQTRCLIKDWKSLARMTHSLSSFICHMSVPRI